MCLNDLETCNTTTVQDLFKKANWNYFSLETSYD